MGELWENPKFLTKKGQIFSNKQKQKQIFDNGFWGAQKKFLFGAFCKTNWFPGDFLNEKLKNQKSFWQLGFSQKPFLLEEFPQTNFTGGDFCNKTKRPKCFGPNVWPLGKTPRPAKFCKFKTITFGPKKGFYRVKKFKKKNNFYFGVLVLFQPETRTFAINPKFLKGLFWEEKKRPNKILPYWGYCLFGKKPLRDSPNFCQLKNFQICKGRFANKNSTQKIFFYWNWVPKKILFPRFFAIKNFPIWKVCFSVKKFKKNQKNFCNY